MHGQLQNSPGWDPFSGKHGALSHTRCPPWDRAHYVLHHVCWCTSEQLSVPMEWSASIGDVIFIRGNLRNTDHPRIIVGTCVCITYLCAHIWVFVCVQCLKRTTISRLLQGDYCDQSNIAPGPVHVCVCVYWMQLGLATQAVCLPWPGAFWPMESSKGRGVLLRTACAVAKDPAQTPVP